MVQRMTAEFTSRIQYNIVTARYPVPQAEWKRMTFVEKLDEQLFGGSSIKEITRRFDPEIIYSDSALYAAQFELMSLLSPRRPLILHLRGDWWREHSAAFELMPWRKRILSMQQYSYNWTAAALASKITPICGWLQEVVRHHLPWKRTEIVYQGVDSEQFQPEAGLEVQEPAVAIIQNHSIYPKVEGLLIFRAVVEKLPQVHFYIAEGEAWAQQFLPLVKKRYAGFTNVHFVKGITSTPAVRKLLTACNCYVLASGLDCCPTTVLEASLIEKPVLASHVGGVPEIVADGYTGWTISNEDAHKWVSKIQILLRDTKLSRRLGRQGRKWVSDNFSWAVIAPHVERLIIEEAERRR
jgi:glycosyltransferase involved in cell wall biosynthesis